VPRERNAPRRASTAMASEWKAVWSAVIVSGTGSGGADAATRVLAIAIVAQMVHRSRWAS